MNRLASIAKGLPALLSAWTLITAAETRTLHIATHSGTPVREICETLQRELGWQISYEEAPVFDRTTLEPRTAPSGRELLALRRNPMSFDVALPDVISNDNDRRAILKAVFDYYHASGNRAGFEYILGGERVQVFQNVAIGEDGRPGGFQPMLDTKVSIPQSKYVLLALVNDIISQISQKRGIRISLGITPKSFIQDAVTEEANDEPARGVLARAFDEANIPRLMAGAVMLRATWFLNFEPNGRFYFFNVVNVGVKSVDQLREPSREDPAPSPYFKKPNRAP
ncbi:MAG: hypothetical protein ABSB67_17910 [Bryobacteraceae bacterium]